jgi:hypothetical protein
MSLSHDIARDDQYLVRYLLGLLPDDEAERLDEAAIVDDEFACRLRNVEEDLVDAYVAGTLDWDTLQRFGAIYLASPLRREKVKFAERFLNAVDRTPLSKDAKASAAEVKAPAVDVIEKVQPLVARPEAMPRVAPRRRVTWLAAAAVVILSVSALLFEEVRLQRGLDQARRQGAAISDRAEDLEKQLDDQRAANTDTRRELDRIRTAQLPTPAFVLLPQTRATAPVSTIAVPPGTGFVTFELRLDANDFPRYQAALRDPATNLIVWRSDILTPNPALRSPTVSVAIPARVMKPQHYALELAGRPLAGGLESVGNYGFQIETR